MELKGPKDRAAVRETGEGNWRAAAVPFSRAIRPGGSTLAGLRTGGEAGRVWRRWFLVAGSDLICAVVGGQDGFEAEEVTLCAGSPPSHESCGCWVG